MEKNVLQDKLFFAIEEGNFSGIRSLLDQGADVNTTNEKGETPLAVACYELDTESIDNFIRYFLSKGADINKFERSGFTPLFNAVLANRPAVVQLLLEEGANPNINFFPDFFPDVISTALDVIYMRYLEAIIHLMQGDKDPNLPQEIEGCRAIMFLLTEAGGRIHEKSVVPEYN